MGRLPEPARGGSIGMLREFINVEEAEWALVVGWLVEALRAEGNYPVLPILGGQGDGKTTLARVLKRLVDPHAVEVRAAPDDLRDLAAAARNSHLLVFDNLSRLRPQISDALCRLSTGGGLGGRLYYTNLEEAAFDARRPVILTSIAEVASRSDLLDRAVIVSMLPLADRNPGDGEKSRETEEVFWTRFDGAAPQILGVLYDALAAGLRDQSSVRLTEKTRMADFAAWASACLPALDISSEDFLDAYLGNREAGNDIALEASLIAEPVQVLAASGWRGTMQGLLDRLRSTVEEQVTQLANFPKSPRALRAELNRIKPNLRARGVDIDFKTSGRRGVTIKLKAENNFV
jgi:hypothetical protein